MRPAGWPPEYHRQIGPEFRAGTRARRPSVQKTEARQPRRRDGDSRSHDDRELSASAGAAPRPGYLRLAGSAAPFTSHTRATGAVAGSTRLTIQVWLRPGHLAAAQQYATAVSTPGSTMFHHYLSPDAYTARFGASRPRPAAVESWLRRQGFTGINTDAQRNYVRATAGSRRSTRRSRPSWRTTSHPRA